MNKQQFTDSVFLSLETVLCFIDRPASKIVYDVSKKPSISDSHKIIYWYCEAVEEAVDKFPSRWKNKKILRSLL